MQRRHLRELFDRAFDGEFADTDYDHALGGLHVMVASDGGDVAPLPYPTAMPAIGVLTRTPPERLDNDGKDVEPRGAHAAVKRRSGPGDAGHGTQRAGGLQGRQDHQRSPERQSHSRRPSGRPISPKT